VPVTGEADIVAARGLGRKVALRLGFSTTEATLVATAISELTRNIVTYAKRGEIVIRMRANSGRLGIEIVAMDQGPGIPSVEQALKPGFSTSGGLGLGLPGVRRVSDEFQVTSEVGKGTTVRALKWTR
jgi:serine/threonine-protein kinase RsbT